MTGRERMLAAMCGQPVDRVPLWLREGFDFHLPAPRVAGFGLEWRAERDYQDFWHWARPFCDSRVGWSPGGHFNRFLCIPPDRISSEMEQVTPDLRRHHGVIDTPKGKLTFLREHRRGVQTSWSLKHPVENLADLEKLRSIPFELAPVNYQAYERAKEQCGDAGVICLGLSSPCVVISGCMPFDYFLELSTAEPNLFHELLEEVTQRILTGLTAVFERPLDTVANIGGSEQCTPPMMSPARYDEYVTAYDRRLVSFLNNHGVPVNCHCHGRVRNALPGMLEAGFASTDPVEPPRAGDVTIAEARELVGDQLTLVGNFEFDELETATEAHVRTRVREIFETGKRRLVLSASAGPISKLSPRLLANYRALIEEALERGAA